MKLSDKDIRKVTDEIVSIILANKNIMKFTDLVNEIEYGIFERALSESIRDGFKEYNVLYDSVTLQLKIGKDMNDILVTSEDLPEVYLKASYAEALALIPKLVKKARG